MLQWTQELKEKEKKKWLEKERKKEEWNNFPLPLFFLSGLFTFLYTHLFSLNDSYRKAVGNSVFFLEFAIFAEIKDEGKFVFKF